MNADARKTALRMIPYGIHVLTADDGKGNVAAATVNWVTQTAFAPPLLVEAPGALECEVTSIVEQGDPHIVVGEVIEADLNNKQPTGRPDAAILEMKDLGDNAFYGG